jgi:hypothetical protein
MPLDPETLQVETFATTPAPAAAPAEGKLTRITSCNPPPYCTC